MPQTTAQPKVSNKAPKPTPPLATPAAAAPSTATALTTASASLQGSLPSNGQVRAVVDAVLPIVDGGRFAVKAVVGQNIAVTAHCFTDGHDVLRVQLRWRDEQTGETREAPMVALPNDIWQGTFTAASMGRYVYTVVAWVDPFESWRRDMSRRIDPEDIRIAAQVGALEILGAAQRASDAGVATDRAALETWARDLQTSSQSPAFDGAVLKSLSLDESLGLLAGRYPDRRFEAIYPVELPLIVDRARAGFSTWYELFPRSASPEPGRHGTFKDVEARLPAIAGMGFDVLYFPPIHPIGRIQRKGRNNKLVTEPGDVGSPWAIGADEGGHKSILPELGTAEDFRHLVAAAAANGLELALDIAFQCAPDHPYVKEHPSWFRWRPDNTVQYAENPPKKYQDIYPFNFESDDWQALWLELKSVFDHWIGEGVKIFRVDNPHTKSFAFWEWVVTEIKREHPDVLFLAEAFTRPKVMHRLAKLGYSQSYTYFTWRTAKWELEQYFKELSSGLGCDYFRPNVWPNTPDILHEQLHRGDTPTYMTRLVLATTLSSNYGMYGPVYELKVHQPRDPGSEEYLDSEKYQLRHFDLDDPASLAPFIGKVNRIRRRHPALQRTAGLRFLQIDNDQIIAYAKTSADGSDAVVTIVNLDPNNVQAGWVNLDPFWVGADPMKSFQMHDLLSDQRFVWEGHWHFVQLDPWNNPAHILSVVRIVHNEQDLDQLS